jgi:protein-tyrosine-phosphatase
MNNEQINLEVRAARHAALADPTRLRMLDLLALGDLAPRELEARLSIPSNLLAHHLKVLEHAGLIVRTRSEGDRRRNYVRMVPEALRGLDPQSAVTAARVVFVCTANSARSQLAEHLWRTRSDVPAASAGTSPAPAVAAGAVRTGARHGLDLSAASPRVLSDVEMEGDLLITVCDSAHETLGVSDLHWSVPDPVAADTGAAYEAAFRDISARIDTLAPRLSAA